MRPDVTIMQERVCDCGYRKRSNKKFMLTAFSKSVVLRTKLSFNKSEVIAL